MRILVALVVLVACASAQTREGRTIIPETPAMSVLGNNLVMSVGENNRVSIQYGEGADAIVHLDDPSQSTIDAIRLGFSIGEAIHSATELSALETKLRAESQTIKSDLLAFIASTKTDLVNLIASTKTELNSLIASTKTELIARMDQIRDNLETAIDTQNTKVDSNLTSMSNRIRTVEDLKGPAWAISISNEVSSVKTSISSMDQKVDSVRVIAETVDCGQPAVLFPNLANTTCSSTGLNAVCNVECDTTRFFEVNKATVTCRKSGSWVGIPSCVPRIGMSKDTAGLTCREIKEKWPDARDGTYWIHANIQPFRVWCDMTLDGGGWTLISTVGSGDSKVGAEGKVFPVHGYDVENLVQNKLTGRNGWGDLGETKVNAIHRAYRNSILKAHLVGPGYYPTGYQWYFRKYDDVNCGTYPFDSGRFNLFRGIRNTWIWGNRGDRACGFDAGLNNYEVARHRASSNGGRMGRDGMQWWDFWTIRFGPVGDDLDWQLTTVSRHGIPGDINGGCEWMFNFATDQNTISYGFCNTDSFSRLLVK